jgi:hypothetical protein
VNTKLEAITVTKNDDDTVTIAGIHGADLSSILIAASLHAHDDARKAEAEPLDGSYPSVVHQNNLDAFLWRMERRLLIKVLEAAFKHAASPQYNQFDLPAMLRMHQFEVDRLEETVQKAEADAAVRKANAVPDLVGEAAARVAKALREADSALAALNRARQQ